MLKVYTGPMFSGKTNAIIRDFLGKYEWVKPGVYEWFRPVKDTRSEYLYSRELSERDIKIPFYSIKRIEEIDDYISEKTKSIYVDEGNFLEGDPTYLFELSVKGKYKKRIDVYVNGLSLTSEQYPFPSIMPGLLVYATDIEVRKAQCVYCGEPAPYSYNSFDKESAIVVGDIDEGYQAVCEDCLCWLREERGQTLVMKK